MDAWNHRLDHGGRGHCNHDHICQFWSDQVVDGNWGVHADIEKWVFDGSDTPDDYSCAPQTADRRLQADQRRALLEKHGVEASPKEYAAELFSKVTSKCDKCGKSAMRHNSK